MRIRCIKPEFFTHEELFNAEKSAKLPLRIAFAGLWCAADREGRFKWEPRRLGVAILPYDGIDFSRVLDALTTRGFVVKYASQGREFGWIPSFTRHQVINNREKPSGLPEPSTDEASDATGTRASRVDHASKAEGKGREGNMEGEGERKGIPPTPLPAADGATASPSLGGAEKAKDIPTTQPAIFLAEMFNRKLTTAWSAKEIKAFKSIGPIDMADLELMARYYASERKRGEEGIHRRDLKTFLNNFQGELDRAREFAAKPAGRQNPQEYPEKLLIPDLTRDEPPVS